jgi:cation diffusion facilitator CzcD-associated flavoprotein CzcO
MAPRYQKTSDVIIIGAGMSGILMGIRLLQAGITSFEIIEKTDRPGGTWRENTYPGLQCDVPAYLYCYSFEPNPECSSRYATGAELQEYFTRIFNKYGLQDYTRFNTTVTSARWQDDGWLVKTEDGQARHAHFVIAATGILHHPKMPDIAGLDDFDGDIMHSARWQNDVSIAGRRVGIIGTGSTSVQIVGAIAEKVEHLDVFQRTPHWVVPAFDRLYGQWRKPLMRRFPIFSKLLFRWYEMIFNQLAGSIATSPVIAFIMQRGAQLNLRFGIKDPGLRRKLTPDYRAGCKRLILNDHFYKAMQRPNVDLVTEGIERIEKTGVRTRDGKLHELDILVLATGFHIDFCWPLDFIGRDGNSLWDVWKGGIQAYRSLMVPKFPNLFFVPGPHSPVGNFSLVTGSEIQTHYIMQLIKLFREGRVTSLEPRQDATLAFNMRLKEAAKKTVWTSGCKSWYLDSKGNLLLWPWSFTQFRREMKQPDLADFQLHQPDRTATSLPAHYETLPNANLPTGKSR